MFLVNSIVKPFFVAISCVFLLALPQQLAAAELQSVSFDVPDGKAFDLIVNGETQAVTLAEIEGLGMYQTTTPSPWEKGELTFAGPLLADVVDYLGLGDEPVIVLRALDGFTTDVPRKDWLDGPVMLATRHDGKSLTRRSQGPTRLVYPQIDHPAFADPSYKQRWIWLIASVETPE